MKTISTGLFFVLLCLSVPSFAGSYFVGVYQNSCMVATPIPDPLTQKVIDNTQGILSSLTKWKPGDTVTVCNVKFCATYTFTNDREYINGRTQLREDHPEAGTGGGGGGGGGSEPFPSGTGGYGGNGGNWGGGGRIRPTVTVG